MWRRCQCSESSVDASCSLAGVAAPGGPPGARGCVAPPPDPALAAVVPAPLLAPAGFWLALGAELPASCRFGAELVGTWVLSLVRYQWPVEGWVLGRARRVCRWGDFSHVVGYASGVVSAWPGRGVARAKRRRTDRVADGTWSLVAARRLFDSCLCATHGLSLVGRP